MLKITNLHVKYGVFEVLHGINLEINEGEIVALLGSNGAGKTTTISAVSGLIDSSDGSIEFDGQEISDIPVHIRPTLGITQVPEGGSLFPQMSVLDNMLLGSYIKKTRASRKENLEYCFELFPKLYQRRSQMAGSLSGGEQRMCAIARGIMQQPRLIMLDEPSLGLAPVIVDDLFDIILKINRQGVTVLLVEQNVLTSLSIAHRAYVIETGQNVVSGFSKDLMENDDIKKAYLGI